MRFSNYITEEDNHVDFNNFSESQVQKTINIICKKLNLPSVMTKKMKVTNNYEGEYTNFNHKFGTYVIELKDESNILVALHELVHHYQYLNYSSTTPHDSTFIKGSRKIMKEFNKLFNTNYHASLLLNSNLYSIY